MDDRLRNAHQALADALERELYKPVVPQLDRDDVETVIRTLTAHLETVNVSIITLLGHTRSRDRATLNARQREKVERLLEFEQTAKSLLEKLQHGNR